MAEEGTWVDVAPMHEPERRGARTGFDRGVGLDGYERGTGGDVNEEPEFKRPGDQDAARRRPFSQ